MEKNFKETDTLDTFRPHGIFKILLSKNNEIVLIIMKLNIECLLISILEVLNMQFCIYSIQDFYACISYKNANLNLKEPFKGLFTQGMVCHETYKDDDNNWISPDEIETINGEKFSKEIIQ